MADQTFIAVAKKAEIPEGQVKSVLVKGNPVLICHTPKGFFAVEDTCTHDDGPLGEGWLEGEAIECPRHGARFDVTTGKVLCLPAAVPIKTYPVNSEGDIISVKVD